MNRENLYNNDERHLDNKMQFISSEPADGGKMIHNTCSLMEYINKWLELYKKNEVKPATLNRLHISNELLGKYPVGQMRICDLTSDDVQLFINQLMDDGYSFGTIKKELELVRASMRKAVKQKLIAENPGEDVSLPNKKIVKKKERDVSAYDEDEQKRIFNVIASEPENNAYRCIAFMIKTGLRSGEALALKWKDVSLERVRCNVHATLVDPRDPRKAYVQDSPKTDASNRTVPLIPEVVKMLKEMKARATCEFVFERAGRRLEYPELVWMTKKLCHKANVPYKGEHVFRHTFATNCYYKGIDIKILSKLLGHSDVKVTLNTYVNLYGDGFDTLYTALSM